VNTTSPFPRVLRSAPVLALVAVVALAACGSSDDSSSATTTAPSTTAVTATSTTAATGPDFGPGGPGGPSGVPAPTPTESDIAYADTSSAQTLDLWLPEGTDEPVPLVVWIHGGAFKLGDKSMVGGTVQPLLDAGYAVASLNYRLSGEAVFPAGPQDVKAAVRFLRANADEYGLNPDQFAAWGGSAGGNLAALLGTTGDQDTVLDDPALGNADTSSAMQAVVDWFGPTDFLQMDTQAASGEGGCTAPEQHDPASSPESEYLGAPIQTVPDDADAANPITYIATADELPPFQIAHGDADCNVPFQQSEILADAIEAAGGEVTLTILPGATHADPQFDATQVEPAIAFLDETFGRS